MSQPLRSYAIFADDVRQEANGKTFFIGVYRDYMYFQGPPPWYTPAFHIHVVFREEIPPFSMVSFEVRAQVEPGPGKVIWRGDNPPYNPASGEIGPKFPFEDVSPFAQIVFTVNLTPFIVEAPTRLNLVAIINGHDMLIDRLRVLQIPPTPPPFPRPGAIPMPPSFLK